MCGVGLAAGGAVWLGVVGGRWSVVSHDGGGERREARRAPV